MEMSSLEKRVIEILTRKGKTQLKEDEAIILSKLRRHERLTGNEFWSIYALLRREGPQVKYSNPERWVCHDE